MALFYDFRDCRSLGLADDIARCRRAAANRQYTTTGAPVSSSPFAAYLPACFAAARLLPRSQFDDVLCWPSSFLDEVRNARQPTGQYRFCEFPLDDTSRRRTFCAGSLKTRWMPRIVVAFAGVVPEFKRSLEVLL